MNSQWSAATLRLSGIVKRLGVLSTDRGTDPICLGTRTDGTPLVNSAPQRADHQWNEDPVARVMDLPFAVTRGQH